MLALSVSINAYPSFFNRKSSVLFIQSVSFKPIFRKIAKITEILNKPKQTRIRFKLVQMAAILVGVFCYAKLTSKKRFRGNT